jgi:hypothetical protein
MPKNGHHRHGTNIESEAMMIRAERFLRSTRRSDQKELAMMVKIYWATWFVVLAVAALLFVTGNFTPVFGVTFGFVAFGLVFMGMMSVLPAMVSHHGPAPERVRSGAKKLETVVSGTSEAFRKIGADIAASGSVEMHKPKFH